MRPRADDKPFRIVVLEDLTGVYRGDGGPTTVLAATMGARNFGGEVLGRKIELLSVAREQA